MSAADIAKWNADAIMKGQGCIQQQDCGYSTALPCATPYGCVKHREWAIAKANKRAARLDRDCEEEKQTRKAAPLLENFVPLDTLEDFVLIHHNVKNLEGRLVQNVLHYDAAVHTWPEANVPRRSADTVK